MRKTVLFAAAGVGLMIALASHDAQAFAPMGAMPVAPSDATTVAGGCGFGWHRGPWGGCRRNYSSAWRCFWRGGRRICRYKLREAAPTALLSGLPWRCPSRRPERRRAKGGPRLLPQRLPRSGQAPVPIPPFRLR